MASMRDIKRRRDSIQSTGQITKAMKLVSTVKLQKAKGKAESTKPYSDLMYETVSNILAKSGNINHKFLKAGDSNKKAVIVITANRGLAGGYNNNIAKLITNSDIPKEDAYIYAIGRKGREVLERKGYEIKADYSDVINEPMYTDAKKSAMKCWSFSQTEKLAKSIFLIHPLRTPLSTNQNSLSCFRLNRSSKKRAVQKARH